MNKEEVYTILTIVISIVAIFQTWKQMQLNTKEVLFEKRMDALFVYEKLINFYVQNKHIFLSKSLSADKIKKLYLSMTLLFDLHDESDIEKLKLMIEKIPFLFCGSYIFFLQNFLYTIFFFIQKIYYTQKFLEKIEKFQVIEILLLKDYFLNKTFSKSWASEQNLLSTTYDYIQEKRIMRKLKRQINLFYSFRK